MFPGCTNFENWGHDVPRIRELQKESLARVSPQPIRGQSVGDFFRDKVGLIAPADRRFPSGRAVPITADGYYLTAWHVVDRPGFSLSNFVSLKPLPVGEVVKAEDYYRDELHPGRVVWKSERADLAIVKFDFRPSHQFTLAGQSARAGEDVFSAAVGTNSGSLLISSNGGVGQGVGNGPYQTAGSILQVQHFANEPSPFYRYQSTLVARGGMSGGAVVNATGELVGVLIQIRSGFFSTPRTSFAMLNPTSVAEIITADRANPSR